MSDDQPTYKVTDRRLFNADGTPRDLPPEEKPEPQPEPVTAPAQATASNTETETATPPPPVEAGEELEDEFKPW